ncbi:MAG: polysaccharide biosynthesis tyrosine autokinase [Mucilaginibacter sp.]|nr:polysaccharide biosynthesis tyrosine autokinase [Mucilaginibacter sp.]
MEEIDKIKQKSPNQELDYLKIGKILLSRWYWIAASVIICIIAANIYLWYTPKIYATSATMKLEEKKSDVSDLVHVIGNTDQNESKVQSETFLIQSRSLILNAVKDLNYPISFYVENHVHTSEFELYPHKLFNIKILKFDSLNYYQNQIKFKPIDKHTFSLSYQINGNEVKNNFFYNNPVKIASTIFTIQYSDDVNNNSSYLFKFNNPNDLVNRVRNGLRTSEIIKNSNIISLQETDSNPQFIADILNAIMNQYLKYDQNKKQQSASQIINFVDRQLDTISQKVKRSERAIESYKKKSKIMDVSAAAQTQLTKANEIESQYNLLKIQLTSIEDFKQQVVKEKDNVNLTFLIDGNVEPEVAAKITNLNILLADKIELLKTYNTDAPQITDINKQILQLKNSILQNINLIQRHTSERLSYLKNQLSQINQRIDTLPIAERKLVSLNRDFEINEKVYTFLSEKKLDAQISRSAISPGATIIEQAQPNYSPVSPDAHSIRRTAIISGLIIGLGLIVLIRVLNPYIYDKETVESLTNVPIIGVIRKFPRKMDKNNTDIDILILSQPKSIFAESVRSVRANLSFLASEKKSQVICITSEVAGEGKSFVAVNLSSTLSLIDKKIVLIAADLRRSKLHKTFHVPNNIGLSNFLVNQCSLEDIILHTNQNNLDFIPSGPFPPNPSELLHTDRMKLLLEMLKLKYDIIMIDTAPVGLVSDSIPLIKMSDINIFVIRSGKSKFHAANIPQRIDQEYHLNNSVIVLNAFEEDLLHSRYYTTKFTGDNYGNKYYYYLNHAGNESSGYYVDSKKKKWLNIGSWFK